MNTSGFRRDRRLRGVICVVAVVAALAATAACGVEREKSIDTMGTNTELGPVQLRNVYLEAPSSWKYEKGDDARIRLRLFNRADRDIELVEVDSAWAAEARLRWDRDCDGLIQPVDSLPLLANGSVPYSEAYLVELLEFERPVLAGTSIPVTFTFRDIGTVTVDAMVEARDDGSVQVPPRCDAVGPGS